MEEGNIEEKVDGKTVKRQDHRIVRSDGDSFGEGKRMGEDDHLEERKKKAVMFLASKKNWIYYLILAFIIWLGAFIRTKNLSSLRDITTGTWTLGPDLDPFLFLRWAKDIVANGSIAAIDMMRYVPLGYDTAGEAKLLSYLIVWFHNVLSTFSLTDNVTHSAVIFPVFMFVLATVAFFLFAKKVFYKEDNNMQNIIALLSTAIFVLVPSLLPRTIAGIPEKESAAFFFIFVAFYFFLEAFTSKGMGKSLVFGLLAGVSTGMLALIWGGVTFVFLTIAGAVLFAFLLGQIDRIRFYSFVVWIFSALAIMMPFSTRYTLRSLATSTSTGTALGVFSILLIDYLLFDKNLFHLGKNLKKKVNLPRYLASMIAAIVIVAILTSLLFGISFVPDKITGIVERTVHPIDINRFGLTVAENKQPYFVSDWRTNFGPISFNIPLFFWMFFAGSVLLFNNLIKDLNKKERQILTFGYFIFLIALVFSRYSSGSILNGDNVLSIIAYLGGFVFFVGMFGYYYLRRYKEGNFSVFSQFNFAYILYLVILTMTIVGARGAIRLIMMLGAVTPIAVSFLAFILFKSYFEERSDTTKAIYGIILLVVILSLVFTMWTYYKSDLGTAQVFAPGPYQWQWQNAMGWVRENTPQDAVFAHWWDYGYWVQSIGERATILDGGNAIVYWNHLLGRHVLTGPDENKALEFLYTHDGTHLLIDSTEIGKYTAFSSIGADENYDRFSWISTFLMDEKQTRETSEETLYVYAGGTALDQDIVWVDNGAEILLPERNAGLGAVIIRSGAEGSLSQPQGIFTYQGKQYTIPLKFIHIGDELIEFDSGLDAGVFVFPRVNVESGQAQINQIGALLYLSPRTIHSQLAELYLFDKDSDYLKLAHTEGNLFIEELKGTGANVGDFVYYQGLQGPIKIWEINYPSDIKVNSDLLETDYPNRDLYVAQPGRYN